MNTRGGYFVTPLIAALARRHFQTAELLRHNDAGVYVRGRRGRTPLHAAAWYGDLEMVRVLLHYGADVNARSDWGWTPMHYVSQGYRASLAVIPDIYQSLSDVARLLLEHGAHVGAEDSYGRTPYQIALAEGFDEIMKLLSQHGAK